MTGISPWLVADALRPRWATVAAWKRKLLYLASAAGLAGLGAGQLEATWSGGAAPASAWQPAAAVPGSLSARQASAGAEARGDRAGDPARFTWSGAASRLGLSFAIAFVLALVIRWFVKAALVVAAAGVAATLALAHFGFIRPLSGEEMDLARKAGQWLGAQTESAAALVKGYLPSGAASGAGLFLGLRK